MKSRRNAFFSKVKRRSRQKRRWSHKIEKNRQLRDWSCSDHSCWARWRGKVALNWRERRTWRLGPRARCTHRASTDRFSEVVPSATWIRWKDLGHGNSSTWQGVPDVAFLTISAALQRSYFRVNAAVFRNFKHWQGRWMGSLPTDQLRSWDQRRTI